MQDYMDIAASLAFEHVLVAWYAEMKKFLNTHFQSSIQIVLDIFNEDRLRINLRPKYIDELTLRYHDFIELVVDDHGKASKCQHISVATFDSINMPRLACFTNKVFNIALIFDY